ncbi:MAG: LUD domain-containing protein [Deinococcota bacterium]|jgi:L-lactate utilization protein LutC|nr:LUD domain-containing protein [Deinococcota bacterium]
MTKDAFLKRVRDALHRHPGQPAQEPPPLLAPLADWDAAELADLFAAELTLVGGHVHRVADLAEAKGCLRELVAAFGAKSFLRSADGVVDEVIEDLGIPQADHPGDADVGITGARYGIAATGTLVLTSEAGRRDSLLPMHHVALLNVAQLVPTVAEALESHYRAMPSAWVQATGPSRTADIELTLTTGVHGPGVVHVILIGS